MAENKKSFLLYVDLIHTVEMLPDDKAGELFKHLLRYVNDKNPTTTDMIVALAFEPIKQQLKRDLKVWEKKQEQWSEAGKKSARIRALKVVEGRSTESTVNDNVNVNVNVNGTLYIAPKEFLKERMEVDIEQIQMKSRLSAAEFELCFTQWSLKCEEGGWTYSDDVDSDLKKLRAGFQKWVNSWVNSSINKAKGGKPVDNSQLKKGNYAN